MFWWLVGAIVLFLVVRSSWKTYTHPSYVLCRQAANMNWVAAGVVKDKHGFRNTRLVRDGMEAVISFKEGNVTLVDPPHFQPFANFVELERWLATEAPSYHEQVENYLKSVGHYENVLSLQGADTEFCAESLKVYDAGKQAGQSVKVVGALVADAANKYQTNREFALVFLKKLQVNLVKRAT